MLGDLMGNHGVTMRQRFETEMWVNGKKLPLNYFVQETLANMMVGFTKTLKEIDDPPTSIRIDIKKLPAEIDVDAHAYP